jgi:hypothetical protein
VSLAAETDAVSEANHIAFRYGNVAFALVARLALDDVVVTISPPLSDPDPDPAPTPTPPPIVIIPPGNQPLIIPAVPLEFWLDDSVEEEESSAARGETARTVRMRRGKLRRTRSGRLRQTITLRNIGANSVTDLRLAFTRLPKNARVRIAGDEWVTASQAARGIYLPDIDELRPGETLTVEVEFSNTAAQARFAARVLGELAEPDDGSGPVFGGIPGAVGLYDPDD